MAKSPLELTVQASTSLTYFPDGKGRINIALRIGEAHVLFVEKPELLVTIFESTAQQIRERFLAPANPATVEDVEGEAAKPPSLTSDNQAPMKGT